MLGFDFICFALFFEGVQKKEDRRRAAEGEAGGRHAKMHQGGSSLCGRLAPGSARSHGSACPVADGGEVWPESALGYCQTGGTTKHSRCALVTHAMAPCGVHAGRGAGAAVPAEVGRKSSRVVEKKKKEKLGGRFAVRSTLRAGAHVPGESRLVEKDLRHQNAEHRFGAPACAVHVPGPTLPHHSSS